MLTIRPAAPDDIAALHELYLRHLTQNPPTEPQDLAKWAHLLNTLTADPNYNVLVCEVDGIIVSSVTVIVIPNLTHNMRPYALIENVVTHSAHRGCGYASALMAHASELAKNANCYKIMLLTGSKEPNTLLFYEHCGFNKNDKTGFIKKL